MKMSTLPAEVVSRILLQCCPSTIVRLPATLHALTQEPRFSRAYVSRWKDRLLRSSLTMLPEGDEVLAFIVACDREWNADVVDAIWRHLSLSVKLATIRQLCRRAEHRLASGLARWEQFMDMYCAPRQRLFQRHFAPMLQRGHVGLLKINDDVVGTTGLQTPNVSGILENAAIAAEATHRRSTGH